MYLGPHPDKALPSLHRALTKNSISEQLKLEMDSIQKISDHRALIQAEKAARLSLAEDVFYLNTD